MPLAPQQSFAFVNPAANVGFALLINGYDRTAEVAYPGPRIHLSGTSQGTLDGQLNDPATLPAADDLVVAFTGTQQLFEGRTKSVDVTEYHIGSHIFASFSASDLGPYTGLPLTPPWNVSDTGAGGTHPYGSLKRQVRDTEGTTTISYELRMPEDGLWQGMQVAVTSALLGLAALALNIVDAQVQWANKNAPQYTFTLGTALVNLAQIVQHPSLAPGAITSTMIADGSISTPKLEANAVISQVANIGGTVVIDSSGATITGGALTLINGTTVIIDGTSDMFKIVVTGTTTIVGPAANGTSVSSLVDLGIDLGYAPAFHAWIEISGTSFADTLPYAVIDTSTGSVRELVTGFVQYNSPSAGHTYFRAAWYSSAGSFSGQTKTVRYYIVKELAF